MVITDNFFLTAGDLTELTVVVFYLFHLFKVLVLCTYYLKKNYLDKRWPLLAFWHTFPP